MITFEEFDACSNKAYKATSKVGGVEIAINDTGEAVAWCERWGKGHIERATLCRNWQKIKFTTKGREYFFIHGRREYIDTFIRKNNYESI